MISSRQYEILELLKNKGRLGGRDLQDILGLSRARINQLIKPLLKQRLIKREGRARATVYSLTDHRSREQILRENWSLQQRVRELEKALEDRKIIERAKEILIAQFGILPTEAYRKIQEQSMESNRSMREIAEEILTAYEVL